jgi:hypothetical protein
LLIVILVLQAEIETCMRLLGVEKVEDLGPKFVSPSPVIPARANSTVGQFAER